MKWPESLLSTPNHKKVAGWGVGSHDHVQLEFVLPYQPVGVIGTLRLFPEFTLKSYVCVQYSNLLVCIQPLHELSSFVDSVCDSNGLRESPSKLLVIALFAGVVASSSDLVVLVDTERPVAVLLRMLAPAKSLWSRPKEQASRWVWWRYSELDLGVRPHSGPARGAETVQFQRRRTPPQMKTFVQLRAKSSLLKKRRTGSTLVRNPTEC